MTSGRVIAWAQLPLAGLFAVSILLLGARDLAAKEQVRIAGLTWPGYGFWFIAEEKGLAPDLELGDLVIITKGDLMGTGGGTNAMKIVEVGNMPKLAG